MDNLKFLNKKGENMTEDELVKKLFKRLEDMDDSMCYTFDSLIEYWATVKMALFVAFCRNKEVLLNNKEQKDG